MSTKKQDNRQGMTTRWTSEEKQRLEWLSNHLGVEISNVPRTLLWQHFGNNAELQDLYKQRPHSSVSLPDRVFSSNPELNKEVHEKLNEHCSSIEDANHIIRKSISRYCDQTQDEGYEFRQEDLDKFILNGFAYAILEQIHEDKEAERYYEDEEAIEQFIQYNRPIEQLFPCGYKQVSPGRYQMVLNS